MVWRSALSGQVVQHVLACAEKIIAGSADVLGTVLWLRSDVVVDQPGRNECEGGTEKYHRGSEKEAISSCVEDSVAFARSSSLLVSRFNAPAVWTSDSIACSSDPAACTHLEVRLVRYANAISRYRLPVSGQMFQTRGWK